MGCDNVFLLQSAENMSIFPYPSPMLARHLANHLLMALAMVVGFQLSAGAQFAFDDSPIHYRRTPATDRVAQLAMKLASGEVVLKHDPDHDYLPAILEALDVPVSSQALVFSKTSLQLHRISPETPRAVYFNDDVYVAWVQNGYMIEFASMDDALGGVFYSLSLDSAQPRLSRDRGGCIACHASQRTQRVPGFFIRSVFPREDGRPREIGTVTDHRSPFSERWGGWYVTGTHGQMRHIGNEIADDPAVSEKVDTEQGANVIELKDRLDLSPYLSPHSDIIALLVMEHQMQMQNFITLANFETRKAMSAEQITGSSDISPTAAVSEAAMKRIATAGDKLIEYMLFCGEAPLSSPVQGTSGYDREFESRGPVDTHGRGLRQLDLQSRLFRYPCSYLIYSSSFDALPPPVTHYVRDRTLSILRGEDKSERFSHLSPADRRAILEILQETKPAWFSAEVDKRL